MPVEKRSCARRCRIAQVKHGPFAAGRNVWPGQRKALGRLDAAPPRTLGMDEAGFAGGGRSGHRRMLPAAPGSIFHDITFGCASESANHLSVTGALAGNAGDAADMGTEGSNSEACIEIPSAIGARPPALFPPRSIHRSSARMLKTRRASPCPNQAVIPSSV